MGEGGVAALVRLAALAGPASRPHPPWAVASLVDIQGLLIPLESARYVHAQGSKQGDDAMDICHITLTAARESRLPLFPDEHTYLEVLRRLGAVVCGCLALFAIVAEHLHLLALLSRAAAGRLAQRILLTLRPVVATPLAVRNDIRMVDSRPYLRWLLRYLLEQPRKHGGDGSPDEIRHCQDDASVDREARRRREGGVTVRRYHERQVC